MQAYQLDPVIHRFGIGIFRQEVEDFLLKEHPQGFMQDQSTR